MDSLSGSVELITYYNPENGYTVLTREHIMAEKIRALIMRGKPRDIYDLWLLSRQGVRLDRSLVLRKFATVKVNLSRSKLESALE